MQEVFKPVVNPDLSEVIEQLYKAVVGFVGFMVPIGLGLKSKSFNMI